MITVFVLGGKSLSTTAKAAAKLHRAHSKKQHPVEKNPRVRFFYPDSKQPWNDTLRDVRMIAATPKYVVGLQINDKNRFKKFLRHKMTNFTLVEFNPSAVS